jgi:hypothetical protein
VVHELCNHLITYSEQERNGKEDMVYFMIKTLKFYQLARYTMKSVEFCGDGYEHSGSILRNFLNRDCWEKQQYVSLLQSEVQNFVGKNDKLQKTFNQNSWVMY